MQQSLIFHFTKKSAKVYAQVKIREKSRWSKPRESVTRCWLRLQRYSYGNWGGYTHADWGAVAVWLPYLSKANLPEGRVGGKSDVFFLKFTIYLKFLVVLAFTKQALKTFWNVNTEMYYRRIAFFPTSPHYALPDW